MLPITKANVLKYIPCTEARLHQVFLPGGQSVSQKKYRKLSDRLDMIIRTCLRKGLFDSRSFINDDKQVIVSYYRPHKEHHDSPQLESPCPSGENGTDQGVAGVVAYSSGLVCEVG